MKKGFTLLEIITVIAIIGALTAIVLGFLSSAKTAAGDVQIKSSLGDLRKEAELFANDNGGVYLTATDPLNSVIAPCVTWQSGSDVYVVSNAMLQTSFLSQPTALELLRQARRNVAGNTLLRCFAIRPNYLEPNWGLGIAGGSTGLWVILANMKGNTNNVWCADSAGNSRLLIIPPGLSFGNVANAISQQGNSNANGTCNCGDPAICP